MTLRVGSLFSGVGALELGLERSGDYATVWQCEVDPTARSVLRRHWPDVSCYEDVKEIDVDRLADVDVLCGGWPCQDISVAGARAGLAGERSGLFHELCRVLAAKTPRWVLLENVDGLLSSWSPAEPTPSPVRVGDTREVEEESDLEVVVSELVKLGYGVAWRVLDAQYFGVPQRRRRIFFVGHLGEPWSAPAQVLLEPESVCGDPPKGGRAGEDVASPLGSQSPGSGWNTDLDRMTFVPVDIAHGADLAHSLRGGHRGTDDADRATFVPVPPHAARAITAPTHGHRIDYETENFVVSLQNGQDMVTAENVAQPVTGSKGQPGMIALEGPMVRRLTPKECERLQGVPDDWTLLDDSGKQISDSQRYRLLGNAVCAAVTSWIGARLETVDRKERG